MEETTVMEQQPVEAEQEGIRLAQAGPEPDEGTWIGLYGGCTARRYDDGSGTVCDRDGNEVAWFDVYCHECEAFTPDGRSWTLANPYERGGLAMFEDTKSLLEEIDRFLREHREDL